MPSLAELEDALKNAHAAGDTKAATALADAIHSQASQPADVETQLANSFASAPEESSAAGAFMREAGRSIGPGLAGFGAGALSGAGAGMLGAGPIGSAVGAIGGGLAGAMGVRFGQDAIADEIAPDSFMGTKAAQEDFGSHPVASLLGGAVGGGGRPAPVRALNVGRHLLSSQGRGLLASGLKAEAPAAARLAVSDAVDVAAGAGIGAGMSLASGDGMTMENGLLGAIFNRSLYGGRPMMPQTADAPPANTNTGIIPVAPPEPLRGPVTRMGNGEIEPYHAPVLMPHGRGLPSPVEALPGPLALPAPRDAAPVAPVAEIAPIAPIAPETRQLPAPRVRPDGAPVEIPTGPVIEAGGEAMPITPHEVPTQSRLPVDPVSVPKADALPAISGEIPRVAADAPTPVVEPVATPEVAPVADVEPPAAVAPNVRVDHGIFKTRREAEAKLAALTDDIKGSPQFIKILGDEGIAPDGAYRAVKSPKHNNKWAIATTPEHDAALARKKAQTEAPPVIEPAPVVAKSAPVPEPTTTPVVEAPAPLLGRPLAMAQGNLKGARNQLARMEAAGKTPEQTAKVRARIATLESQTKAGEPFVKDQVRDILDSGEISFLEQVKQMGGFRPPHKNINILKKNAQNAAKNGGLVSEAHRAILDAHKIYDDAPSPAHYDKSDAGVKVRKLISGLYNSDETASTPDQVAQHFGLSMPEFWAKLKHDADHVYKNNGTSEQAAERVIDQHAQARGDFDTAIGKVSNKDKAEAGELNKGDTFEIDGEPVRVVSKTSDSVTLRSERFGDQIVDVDDLIPMDNLKPAAKPAPESAMDRKAADSKQLFADDGGFALKQESTSDGDAVSKARADKEAAAKAADDQQGKMFDDDEDPFGAPAGLTAMLKSHRDRINSSIKGDIRSGKNFAVIPGLDPITAKRVYRLALDVVIKAMEAGSNLRNALKQAMASLKTTHPALTPEQHAAIADRLAADVADLKRFDHQRDGQMRVETAKLAQEFTAAGNHNPTKGDFIRELSAAFPDQAAYIRKNIDELFDGMMFDRARAAAAKPGLKGEWDEWADGWRDRMKSVIQGGKDSLPEKRFLNTVRAIHDTIFTGIGNKIHNLANGKHTGRQSKALKAFAIDSFGIKTGEDGVQRVSADVAAERDSNKMLNPLDGMAGEIDTYFKTAGIPRDDRSAWKARITEHMVDPSRDGELAKQPELKKAVDFFLARRKERLEYMRSNLVDVGDAGERSASRVMDPLKVMANRGEFIDQATKTYRAKWDREIVALRAEAATLKARGKDGDAERYEKIMDKIDELKARDPKDAAAQYFYGIQSGERGVSSDGNDIFGTQGGHKADAHKSREFGTEADEHLGKFMFRDAFDLDAYETTAAVRSVTRARMLATKDAKGDIDPAGKWKELRKQLEDEGNGDMVPKVATLIKSYLNLGGAENPAAQTFLEITHAFTQLAYLSRAGISNLGEPVLIGLRTGSASNMLKAYKLTGRNIARRLRGLPPSESQIIANALGVAKGGMNSLMGAARMQDAFGGRGKLGKLVSAFHVKTLLNDTTMAMHEAATEIARGFIHAELQMAKANGSLARLSRKNLTELGIGQKDIDRMLAFTQRIEKANDKKAVILEDSADARTYRDALTLFNRSGAVLDPTRGSRAQGANNPVGSLFYSLQSFLYEFHQKVTARHGRRLQSAITGKMDVEGVSETLTTAERTKIGTEILAGMSAIYAAQFGVQMVRETLFSDPVRMEKDKRRTGSEIAMQRAKATASRTGIFGPYDILFNMVTQARFQRDAATTLLGPAVGGYSELFKAIVDYSGDRNTDGTNTAERKLARTAYNLTVAPLAGAFAATMPGRLIPGALIQGAYHPGVREQAVKAAAGPAKIPRGPLRRNE